MPSGLSATPSLAQSIFVLLLILLCAIPSTCFLSSTVNNRHHDAKARYQLQHDEPHLSNTALSVTLDTEVAAQIATAGTLAVVTDTLQEMVFNKTALQEGGREEEGLEVLWYGATDSITVSARVYLLLALVGLAADWFHVDLPIDADLVRSAPLIAGTVWAALALSTIKRTLFYRSVSGRKLGRVALYDQLLDFLIGVGLVAFIVDELNIDVGMGLKSVLAGGGIGALAFSLASKELAQNIVGGLTVQAWDAFNVNDDVQLGDGTAGTVKQIGLVETEIVGYDNVPIRIPNSQLSNERISNMSRIKQSRIYQTLRFQYTDLDKLPDVLGDIKEEIQSSCPKLILDGSKPFQALLSSYKTDHIEAFLNVHFDIAPGSNEFFENQQQVLLAVARALKKNGVKVALPAIVYQNKDPSRMS